MSNIGGSGHFLSTDFLKPCSAPKRPENHLIPQHLKFWKTHGRVKSIVKTNVGVLLSLAWCCLLVAPYMPNPSHENLHAHVLVQILKPKPKKPKALSPDS